jgi:hypothetical protein
LLHVLEEKLPAMPHPLVVIAALGSAAAVFVRKALKKGKERPIGERAQLPQSSAPDLRPVSRAPETPDQYDDSSPLDAYLPHPTAIAVTIAASKETDSKKLRTFASSLLPEYPIAASVLLARAALLDMAMEHDANSSLPPNGDPRLTATDIVAAHAHASLSDATGGWNPLHAVKSLAGDLGKIGVVATFIPGVGQTAVPLAMAVAAAEAGHSKRIQKLPGVRSVKAEADRLGKTKAFAAAKDVFNEAHPAYFAAMLASTAGQHALSGERLDKVALDAAKQAGSFLGQRAAVASVVVPGAAPAVVAAMSTAGALASGKKISSSIIGVAANAVPGTNGDAVQAGADIAQGMVENSTTATTALDAAKSMLSDQASRNAVDVGFTLGLAKKLQDADFGTARKLLPASAQHPADAMAQQVATALKLGADNNLVDKSVATLKSILPQDAATATQVSNAASAIVSQPALLRLQPTTIAKELGIPVPVAQAAIASMNKAVPGAPMVDPQKLRTLTGRPLPPRSMNAAHATLALRASQGNASAKKQLTYQAAQDPSQKTEIDHALRASGRALWTKHYVPAPPTIPPLPSPPAPPTVEPSGY